MSLVVRLATLFALALALAAPVRAASPQDILLTVEGRIDGGQKSLTRADLEALGLESVTTTTPWYDGAMTFEGVSLARLFEALKIKGDMVEVVALNNYFVEIPTADLIERKAILAMKRNGAYMAVSDKGPLFIVYPFDADPSLRSEVHYSRSVWQVKSMAFR
ncbi:oxidoreductase [Microvirga tunisiensis]|uniref:Oxidoreductase n=2 Tax=Pannonibacter tanglangensis TaxID=2750084 RepID=A0A7X5F221_9HYPH|nr:MULTISPECIES: molybdopterin-dependent oxidoreductase [unclassified Pannonibacter]NBN62680.1 oxidoreductase [Pannonibacter sp. XCT-34]NBN78335.1 oxidoreductase [Pannonibacter sp. XCT-53]